MLESGSGGGYELAKGSTKLRIWWFKKIENRKEFFSWKVKNLMGLEWGWGPLNLGRGVGTGIIEDSVGQRPFTGVKVLAALNIGEWRNLHVSE